MNTLAKAFLWPGTKICEHMGIDPESDLGLMRSFINFMIWLTVGILVFASFIKFP